MLMDLLALYLLQTGVLLFLARKGTSLECEICQGVKKACQGSRHTCPKVFDTCGIVEMGGKLGFRGVDKICTHSRACNQSFTRINVGTEVAVWSLLACCVGVECRQWKPRLPKVDITLNGKTCPGSLVTKQQVYKEETVRCGGDEIYCFELAGNATTPNGVSSDIKMKGCTTQSVCDHLNSGHVSIVPLGVVGRGNCKLASVATSTIPGLFGLFLPPLAVLPFLKGLL